MGRKSEFEITSSHWFSPRSCYRKYHRGTTWYLGKRLPKWEGLDAAREEWAYILFRLKSGVAAKQIKAELRSVGVPKWVTDHGTETTSNPQPLESIKALIDMQDGLTTIQTLKGPMVCLRVPSSFLHQDTPCGKPIDTIPELINRYIETKRSEALTNQISPAMFREYERNANIFGEWATQTQLSEVNQINADSLSRYKSFIVRLVDPVFAEQCETPCIGLVTVRKRLWNLKNLIEWAYEHEHLEQLPRNIKGYARVKTETADSDASKTEQLLFWTVGEIREMVEAATQRTRLYILLALNCGYTQVDIATLKHSHIDWENSIIQRSRNKTKSKQVHKLWKITTELLHAEATTPTSEPDGGLVLVGENGLPLVRQEIGSERLDAIGLSFNRVTDKLLKMRLRERQPELFRRSKIGDRAGQKLRADKIKKAMAEARKAEPRGFKNFRKTSANLIEKEFGTHSKLAEQFLAHTERATKKWYVDQHFDRLFDALDYLADAYGLKLKE